MARKIARKLEIPIKVREDSVSDATLSDEEMADESSQSEQIGENEALSEESESLSDKKYYLAGAFPVEKAVLIPSLRDTGITIKWKNTRKATLVRLD